MTLEEKEKKIILCIKRVKRLTEFAEVVNTWNELDTTMKLAFSAVMTVVQANQIASQPTPSFEKGGIKCGRGYDCGGAKIV